MAILQHIFQKKEIGSNKISGSNYKHIKSFLVTHHCVQDPVLENLIPSQIFYSQTKGKTVIKATLANTFNNNLIVIIYSANCFSSHNLCF